MKNTRVSKKWKNRTRKKKKQRAGCKKKSKSKQKREKERKGMMRNVKWRIYKSGLKMTQIYIQDYIQNRLSFLVSRPYVFAKKNF